MTKFARTFAYNNMMAYVNDVQRVERNEEIETLQHQRWSGVELKDLEIQTICKRVSTKAAIDSTETKF